MSICSKLCSIAFVQSQKTPRLRSKKLQSTFLREKSSVMRVHWPDPFRRSGRGITFCLILLEVIGVCSQKKQQISRQMKVGKMIIHEIHHEQYNTSCSADVKERRFIYHRTRSNSNWKKQRSCCQSKASGSSLREYRIKSLTILRPVAHDETCSQYLSSVYFTE